MHEIKIQRLKCKMFSKHLVPDFKAQQNIRVLPCASQLHSLSNEPVRRSKASPPGVAKHSELFDD